MAVPTAAALVLGIGALARGWFVILWLAIVYTIASVSGWRRLRLLYATGPFEGATSPQGAHQAARPRRGGESAPRLATAARNMRTMP